MLAAKQPVEAEMQSIFYSWGGLNEAIFHAVNGVGGPGYDQVMVAAGAIGFYQNFGLYTGFFLLFALWRMARITDPAQKKDMAITYLSCAATLCLANWLGRELVEHVKDVAALPRPYALYAEGTFRLLDPYANAASAQRSFPSGHAAFSMFMAAPLWRIANTRARWALAVFVFWMGWARLALGVHFPADVVAGWVIGLAVVWVVQAILRPLEEKARG